MKNTVVVGIDQQQVLLQKSFHFKEDLMKEKERVLEVVNSILSTTPIHKSFLTTFVEGDGDKLQKIEAEDNKINIQFNNGKWGINTLGILNTIISIIADDTLFFIADEQTGLLKEVTWDSQIKKMKEVVK